MSGKPDTGLCSESHGVKAFEIAGRMLDRRERLVYPMTNQERQWRAQFLKDQILAPEESWENYNFDKNIRFSTRNIFRRIYAAPMDFVEEKIFGTRMHRVKARLLRNCISKSAYMMMGIWAAYYWFKYNRRTWEHSWGVDSFLTRDRAYPGTPEWGNTPVLDKEEFYDRGFSKSVLYPSKK